MHGGSGGRLAHKGLMQTSFSPYSHQTGNETVSPLSRRSIDDVAAAAVADVLDPYVATDPNQTLRQGLVHRQHSYRPSSQYPSAGSLPGYSLVPQQSSCASPDSVSANFPASGFSPDVPPEFVRMLPSSEMARGPVRCRYWQSSSGSGQYSPSHVTVSQYRTGSSQPLGAHAYLRHRDHHHPAPHNAHGHLIQQQRRSDPQQQPQLHGSPILQSPALKLTQPDEKTPCGQSSDGASLQEFNSEADIAAQRLPIALKLINDLQRHDDGLRDSVDQLRCYADEMLQQLRNYVLGNSADDAASLELDNASLTRHIIIIACQLCDQALFVLVEWARHAHFFRQLPVTRFL